MFRRSSGLLLAILAVSCSLPTTNTNDDSETGARNIGVGAACSDAKTCRAGLKCGSGAVCEPAGTTPTGAPCSIGGECETGVCGAQRTCQAAGILPEGSKCRGDGDCVKGTRCAFDGTGLFPVCMKEGKTDAGGSCKSTIDCFQGLTCDGGRCSNVSLPKELSPNGIPPVVPSLATKPWSGANCPESVTKGDVRALFQLSREGDAVNDDFYRLPFPNDALRAKATGKVSFKNHPKDPNPPMGFDALGRYLDALESEPFGLYSTVYFRFGGEFDFASLQITGEDPQTRIVDLTEGTSDFGTRRGTALLVTNGRNRYICQNYAALRPNLGDPYAPGHTYGVILKKGLKTKAGAAILPSPDFVALIEATPPTDPVLKDAYEAYAPLRAYLTKFKIPTSDVLVATVFTAGKVRETASKLKTAADAAVPPSTEGWVKCAAGTKSPCAQAEGNRACGTPDPDFDEWHALVDMPIFQKGTAPYLSPKDGGGIDTTAATRREKVCLALTTPKSTPPAGGFPVVVYAHGTGGSFRSHARDNTSKILSKIDIDGASAGFAVLGIDQASHGPRRGVSTLSPDDLFFNFANPAAARGNALQGAADQHTLVRLAKSWTKDGKPADMPALDGSKVLYWGHSQGATEGAMFLAYDNAVRGAVLSGASGGLADALVRKTSPVDIAGSMWFAFSESAPTAVDIYHPVISLLQAWIDPADPLHFAALVAKADVGAAAPFGRHLFQPYGTNDTYTPRETQFGFAVAGGFGFVGPELDKGGGSPSDSLSGNLKIGADSFTVGLRQYKAADYDGHFVAFRDLTARQDLARFLVRVARGAVPKLPE